MLQLTKPLSMLPYTIGQMRDVDKLLKLDPGNTELLPQKGCCPERCGMVIRGWKA